MNPCEEKVSRIHRLVEGELDASATEEMRAHLSECPKCSETYEELMRLKIIIEESLDTVLTAPDIADSIVPLALQASSTGRTGKFVRGFLKKALIGAAACIAAIAVAGYLFVHFYFGRTLPEDVDKVVMRWSNGIQLVGDDGKRTPLRPAHRIKAGQRIVTPNSGRSILSFSGIRILSDGSAEILIDGPRSFSLIQGNIAVAAVPRKKPLAISLGTSLLKTQQATLKLSTDGQTFTAACILGTASLRSSRNERQELAPGHRATIDAARIAVAKAHVEDPFEFLRTHVIERIKRRFAEVMSRYSPRYQVARKTMRYPRGPQLFGLWNRPEEMYRFASYTPESPILMAREISEAVNEYYESLFVPSNRTITIGRQKVVPLPPGKAPSFPRWSYDGSMITFMELSPYALTGRACVVRLDDLDNPWDISQEYSGAVRSMLGATWAPDDRHVLFQVETGPAWDEEGPTGNFQLKIAPIDPAGGPLQNLDTPFYDIPIPLPLPVGKNISPSVARLPWGNSVTVANWGNLAYVAADENGQAVKGAPGVFLTDFNPRECFVMGGGFSPSGSMLHFTGVRNLNFSNMNVYILYEVEDILDGFTSPPRSFDDPRIKQVAPTENMQFTGGFSFDESLNFVHEDVNHAFDARWPTNIFACDFDIFYVNALPGEPGMPTQIHMPGNQMFLVISPEGNRLAYCNYDGNEMELRVVSFDIEADIDVDLGGVLIDNSGTNLIVPPGTLEENFTVKISTPFTIEEEAAIQQGENTFFAMRLIDAEGLENPKFIEPMTLTIRYTDDEVYGLDEWALDVYYYDESDPDNPMWVPLGGTVDPDHNEITVEIQHFSKFSVGGKPVEVKKDKSEKDHLKEPLQLKNRKQESARHTPRKSRARLHKGTTKRLAKAGNARGGNAFVTFARQGNITSVESLLANGIDPDVKDKSGVTALMIAASEGNADIVRALLESGADPNVKSTIGDMTAIMFGAIGANPDVVRLLLESGADPDARTDGHPAPICGAARQGHIEIVKLLLEAGASPNPPPATIGYAAHSTPLMGAIEGKHPELVNLLLANGASLNADSSKNGALIRAAMKDDVKTLESLLKKGADANAQTVEGIRALVSAAALGHTESVKALLANGAAVDATDAVGNTALINAALNNHADIVRILVAGGATPDIGDRRIGRTALMTAAQEGHIEVAKTLMESGADINASDNLMHTALTLAAVGGHADIVTLLLDKGAELGLDGALSYARRAGHKDVVRLLKDAGAQPRRITPVPYRYQ